MSVGSVHGGSPVNYWTTGTRLSSAVALLCA